MILTISVPDYNNEIGFKYQWENGFKINTTVKNTTIYITANKEGLISLANHLLNLAQDEIPTGHHLHLDQHNALEASSIEMIIEKA
jgi:hypothetical protein